MTEHITEGRFSIDQVNESFKNNKNSLVRLKQIISVFKKHRVINGLNPKKVRGILEDMGPTYVKLGQIMSMRSDILPIEYCKELTKLRTEVSPLPFSEIKQAIEIEYDKPINEIFKNICEIPVGSASIAQVHKAILKDSGDSVVIKVQRPGIYKVMENDIILLKKAANILGLIKKDDEPIDLHTIIDELWETSKQEMDFTKEGENIIRFKNLNKDVKYVDCPHVYTDLTTKHILVMQRMKGVQIDQTEKLKELGYDMNEIGLKLSKNYCKQVVDDAFFHADPHPGNIWINDGKIIWLDFGMMGTISKRDKEYFGKAMLAAAQGDVYTLKDIILSIGVVKGDINHSRLYADVDTLLMKYGDMNLGNMNLGTLLEELLETAKKHSISMPGGITMLARGNITIEGVLSDCAPEVNIMQITADHVASKMYKDFDINKQFFSAVRGTQSVVSSSFKIPAQLSDLLKMSLKGHSKLNLELVGSEEPISKIDSMVNRIIVCIIAAGLLVSSGNFLSIESGNEAFGFSVIGIIVFFAAIFLAGGLLVHMVYKGRKKKR